jgi:hypothetical protein
MRFTFFSPHPHPPLAHIITEHAAAFDGTEGYVVMKRPEDIRAIRTVKSLKLAIAGATGISSGSAHTIGRLLLPDVEGMSVLDLINPRFNPAADLDGTSSCYSIKKSWRDPDFERRATCHYGAVVLELDLPDELVDARYCNCSMCRRKGALMGAVPTEALRIVQGHDALGVYRFNIYSHHRRRSKPNQYGYNIGCLERRRSLSADEHPRKRWHKSSCGSEVENTPIVVPGWGAFDIVLGKFCLERSDAQPID